MGVTSGTEEMGGKWTFKPYCARIAKVNWNSLLSEVQVQIAQTLEVYNKEGLFLAAAFSRVRAL
jgi:hypothetical protein